MKAFVRHTGRVAAMDRANVDTDQIIPKQFLKRIERTGFGKFLFFDWRFLADGSDDPAFELNRPEAKGASILLARRNFGRASQTSSTTTVSRTVCCPSRLAKKLSRRCSSEPRRRGLTS